MHSLGSGSVGGNVPTDPIVVCAVLATVLVVSTELAAGPVVRGTVVDVSDVAVVAVSPSLMHALSATTTVTAAISLPTPAPAA